MKSFTNANPRDMAHAVTLMRQARQRGLTSALAGGGSDLLGMIKERLVEPDILVNLKAVNGLDQVTPDEKLAYENWRNQYQSYWRGAFDPIGAKLTMNDNKLALDLSIRPLIAS